MKSNIKLYKFLARVLFTFILMLIGALIFFLSANDTLKIVGSNMVTGGWAAWLSVGSSKVKEKIKTKDQENLMEV